MKRLLTAVFVALTALSISCNDLGDGGGGGGGGGVNFTRGFAYVNPDDRNVYIADQSDLTNIAALTTSGGNAQPAISPTGKQVAFVHRDGAGNAEIDVVSTSGAAPSVLVPADGTHPNARTPVFSQDGASIIFAYDNGGTSQLAIVGTNGAGLQDLTSGALSYAAPSVSRVDGSVYAAAGNSASELTQIERIDLSTGQANSVTNGLPAEVTTIAERLAVSPDGTRAAFEGRISSGVTRIFEIDLTNTANVTQLTDHPGDPGANDSYPTWVGTGTIAFSSDLGGANQVYTAPSGSTGAAGTLTLPSAMMPYYGP